MRPLHCVAPAALFSTFRSRHTVTIRYTPISWATSRMPMKLLWKTFPKIFKRSFRVYKDSVRGICGIWHDSTLNINQIKFCNHWSQKSVGQNILSFWPSVRRRNRDSSTSVGLAALFSTFSLNALWKPHQRTSKTCPLGYRRAVSKFKCVCPSLLR